eukprot:scaffold672190_cov71-Prasinocladus_malaysianus.AAC.1
MPDYWTNQRRADIRPCKTWVETDNLSSNSRLSLYLAYIWLTRQRCGGVWGSQVYLERGCADLATDL